jgi:hypothetical protein
MPREILDQSGIHILLSRPCLLTLLTVYFIPAKGFSYLDSAFVAGQSHSESVLP